MALGRGGDLPERGSGGVLDGGKKVHPGTAGLLRAPAGLAVHSHRP